MEFSIGSWSFHRLFESGQMNLFAYLESLKYRYHLRHADIWNGMMVSTDDDYIAKLRDALRREEISIACLAVDGAHIWDKDHEVREAHRRLALRYLDIARTLGARMVRIDTGSTTPILTEEQFEFVVTRYREYAKFALENGFVVGPQTHQPPVQIPRTVEKLVASVDSKAFAIVMDVGRWLEDADIGDRMCAQYAKHVHFDSSRTTTMDQLRHQVTLLRQSGYDGCWSLEYRLAAGEYEGVAVDLARLRVAVLESYA